MIHGRLDHKTCSYLPLEAPRRIPAMHIHILGICGTFMGGLAALAREAGHKVTGCDAGVYPPMSDQLRALGIELIEGFGAEQISPTAHREAETAKAHRG